MGQCWQSPSVSLIHPPGEQSPWLLINNIKPFDKKHYDLCFKGANIFDKLTSENILRRRHGHRLLTMSPPIYGIFNDPSFGKILTFPSFKARNHIYELPHFIGEKSWGSKRRNNSFKVSTLATDWQHCLTPIFVAKVRMSIHIVLPMTWPHLPWMRNGLERK